VLVTHYTLPDAAVVSPMSPLNDPRENHACGVYQTSGGGQMLIVAGGALPGLGSRYKSTEVLDLSQGLTSAPWILLKTGDLPSAKMYLAGATIAGSFYVCGGSSDDQDMTSINKWDPDTETWNRVATMNQPRNKHAVTVVRCNIVLQACS